jgi:hypothetical protein
MIFEAACSVFFLAKEVVGIAHLCKVRINGIHRGEGRKEDFILLTNIDMMFLSTSLFCIDLSTCTHVTVIGSK